MLVIPPGKTTSAVDTNFVTVVICKGKRVFDVLIHSLLLEILKEFPNSSSDKAIYYVSQTYNHQENLQGKN